MKARSTSAIGFAGRLRPFPDPAFERRRLDGARTNRVCPDALSNEVGGDRFGQSDHRGLGRAVGIAIGNAADGRHRGRDIDDRARLLLQHAGQECPDRAMHRLDVEIEREVPVLFGALEHAAVVHIAGAVDEHVERAEFGGDLLGERLRPTAVERASSFRRLALLMPSSLLSSTSVAITLAPSAAKASAIARPIPCPAAVTSATLPCRRFAIRSFLRHTHINGIPARLVHAAIARPSAGSNLAQDPFQARVRRRLCMTACQ